MHIFTIPDLAGNFEDLQMISLYGWKIFGFFTAAGIMIYMFFTTPAGVGYHDRIRDRVDNLMSFMDERVDKWR